MIIVENILNVIYIYIQDSKKMWNFFISGPPRSTKKI